MIMTSTYLFLNYKTSNSNLQAFQDELFKNAGTDVGKFYPLKCDITNDDEIRKTFDWIKGQLKSVSILINGAGIASPQDNDLQSRLYNPHSTFDLTYYTDFKD